MGLVKGAIQAHHHWQSVDQGEAADPYHQSTQLLTRLGMFEFVGDEAIAFDVGADA